MSGKRIYIGKMPRDAMKQDVEKFFDGYGQILDCRIMNGFGFVEFENPKDAEDVVSTFQGKKLLGEPVIIELAKESRRERGGFEERGPRPFTRRPGYRILIHGVSRDTSWQDLKDFGREAGAVTFSDIDRDNPGEGILEYLTPEDQENAIRVLNGKELRGTAVRVTRGEGGLGGNGADYSRDRDFSRRDRSRSPGRRDPYERRRSPPRRDYDERPRYDDRDRRDSTRDRYAEAPPRAAAGEDRHAERPARYDDRPKYDDRERRDAGGRNGYEDRGASRYEERPARGGYPDEDRPRRDDRRGGEGRDGGW